jgi:hypothetical protein
MSAHDRLAEADLPARIHPGTRTHAVHLWDLSVRVGIVLPQGPRLVFLSLPRHAAHRSGAAFLVLLPRPASV